MSKSQRLHVDWLACDGHGLCGELLPEVIDMDEWGFPIFDKRADVPKELVPHAREAVRRCPAMALKLVSPKH